jgi:ABC-type glutathione transport system ATPase component
MPRFPRADRGKRDENPDGLRDLYVLRAGKAEKLTVKTGASDGRNTVILDGGLKDGDEVITAQRTAASNRDGAMNALMLPGERPPIISLRGLRRFYGQGAARVHALDGVDLDIAPGEFVAIMGASGSGKSTCMNIIGCLDRPTAGSYHFSGVDVTALDNDGRALLRRNYLGFVFQGFNLLPRTTALENVELPLVYRGMKRAERERRAAERFEVRGAGRPRGPHASRTLRRPAAARRHCPRHRHRPAGAAGGRTHRQS